MYYLPTSDWAEVPYVVFQDQRVAELVTTSVFLLPIMQLFCGSEFSGNDIYGLNLCGQDEVLYINSQLCTEFAVQFSMPVSSPVRKEGLCECGRRHLTIHHHKFVH